MPSCPPRPLPSPGFAASPSPAFVPSSQASNAFLSTLLGTPCHTCKDHVGTSVRPTASRCRSARCASPRMIFPWGKKQDSDEKHQYIFDCGYSYLAHPEKGSGEDAFFIAQGTSAGVFDGVSGAAEIQGVDPRLFSQTLAAMTYEKVKQLGAPSVVKAAIEASNENDQIGASTACVIGLDEFGRLFGVNLGDSGVMIVRNGKQVLRTKEQQHFFNCPYQLTSITDVGGYNAGESMSMGQNIQMKLKPDDWVILATDGLWDNATQAEILAAVAQTKGPMELAETLGDVATQNATNEKYFSPFMQAAQKANVEWQGGKVDDITIVTLQLKDDPDLAPVTLLSTLPEREEELQEEQQVESAY